MSSEFIPEKTKEVKVTPKDLVDLMGAVEACATAFTVLDKAYLPHSYAQATRASLQFLAKLHEQSIEAALKHPQAHMVPELKELMAKDKADSLKILENVQDANETEGSEDVQKTETH